MSDAVDPIAEEKKAIGKRIEAARLSLALNQSELSRMVGVSAQAVQQWEKGETTPRGKNLAKISESLQTTPPYLQFGDLASKKVSTSAPRDMAAFMQSKAFEKMYHESIQALITAGCDMSWLSCKTQSNLSALADIGLLKLRQNKTLQRK
ncbi:MAG: transcriptional regulator with XRE-family HTH domain [Alteromonadaceae bacterium]|jgi:transcriptional regulator with XRE-family HTH domain